MAVGVGAAFLLSTPAALAQPSPAAPAPPSSEEAPCPKARIVKGKPKELQKKLRKTTAAAELKKLLEPWGLLTGWKEDTAACPAQAADQITLDVFRARIVTVDQEDFVLQARGRLCDRALLSGKVLHPLAEADTFCAIDVPFLPGEKPYHIDTTFGFEHLTHPVRQVFKVVDRISPTGGHEGGSSELSYWEAQKGKLQPIFSIETSTSTAGSSIAESSDAKVTVVGDTFPRELQIDESHESCGVLTEMPSGEYAESTGCSSAENQSRYCYQRPDGERDTRTFAYSKCHSE